MEQSNTDCISFQFSPNVLSYIIAFITNNDEQWKGYFYIICLMVLNVGKTLTSSQAFYQLSTLGLRAKTALNCAIYSKALKLSTSAKRERTGLMILFCIVIQG